MLGPQQKTNEANPEGRRVDKDVYQFWVRAAKSLKSTVPL